MGNDMGGCTNAQAFSHFLSFFLDLHNSVKVLQTNSIALLGRYTVGVQLIPQGTNNLDTHRHNHGF